MTSYRRLKTSKYSKCAQDYKQNWIAWIRSTWPVAAAAQTTIYTRRNFCFKILVGIENALLLYNS